jgi:hypothetical protein
MSIKISIASLALVILSMMISQGENYAPFSTSEKGKKEKTGKREIFFRNIKNQQVNGHSEVYY